MSGSFPAGLRRLPVYLVLDVSGSMSGAPIEAVQRGINALLNDLREDPQALETVWLSVITFESSAKQVVPLTEVGLFQEPTLTTGEATSLGKALTLLQECIDKEVHQTTTTQKGNWRPLIFIMTDGMPTDNWERPADELKKKTPGHIIACAIGLEPADRVLKRITEVVIRLTDTSPGTLSAFIKWVTESVIMTSESVASRGDAAVNLPTLPQDRGIQVVA